MVRKIGPEEVAKLPAGVVSKILSAYHSIHSEESFFEQFVKDMNFAKALVIIQSAFITEHRVQILRNIILKCIKRRVRVCVYLQSVAKYKMSDEEHKSRVAETERLAQLLRSWGVHVSYRELVHRKICIVDDSISWSGSLNILSHRDTGENVDRWTHPSKVADFVTTFDLYACEVCMQKRRQIVGANCSSLERSALIIGKAISDRRRSLRISQTNLAEITRISRTTINKIETGSRVPSLSNLSNICDALKLELRAVPVFYVSALDEWLSL